jgi:hypothetical protein
MLSAFASHRSTESSEAVFVTGWAGGLTFAEIREQLTPNLYRLLRYYRRPEAELDDQHAHCFMRLWMELSANPAFLANASKNEALRLLLNRTSPQSYRKHDLHEVSLEELADKSSEADDFIIDGYSSGGGGHAKYTRAVDQRLDIERAIQTVALRHMNSLPHLVALYYITTSVNVDAAAALAGRSGGKKGWWLTSIVKPVREELQELLALYDTRRNDWRSRFLAGDERPMQTVIERHASRGNSRMVLVLKSMAAHENCNTLGQRLGVPKSTVFYLRRMAHMELNRAYASGA